MFRHDVNDAFLRELGHVVVSFALLEDLLRFFVIGFLDGPKRLGVAVTSELSTKQLRLLAATLAIERLGESPRVAEIKKLLARAADREEERNRILHSFWGPTAGQQGTITRAKDTAKEKHGLRFTHQDYTVEQLHAVGDSMLALASDLQECQDALVAEGTISDPYER